MFLVLQLYFIPRSRHCGLIATQSEIPLLLEHVLIVWWFFATPVLFDVFVFLPVVLVLQWYARSRSLVGQRWCLTWCLVIFVWLQCYMRSSACWIATLWLDSHSVWDSSAFRARFISVMVLCHSRFLWRVCVPTGSRVLGITVVCLFEMLGWSTLMFDVMFGYFRLTAVLHALICLPDRNTVAWNPFSLTFVPFLSSFNNFIETLPVFLYLTNCVFSCRGVFCFTLVH